MYMKKPEYIGISGVVCREQQAELETMFKSVGLHTKRMLQLGVKATHKTHWLGVVNKYGPEWYPIGNDIGTCTYDSIGTTRVAQACLDDDLVYDGTYRAQFVSTLLERTDWNGVQFDMLPDWCVESGATIAGEVAVQTHQVLDDWLPATVTLQCQAEIMQQHTPAEIACALTGIQGLSYVLFDASGGRGVRMNPDALLPYIEAVRENLLLDDVGIAVGGGLNAEVVRQELPKILRHFPVISWDAEGQLHPVNGDGKRPLDMQVVKEYLEACAEVLE